MLKSTPMTSKNRSRSSIFKLNQDTPEIHSWYKYKLGPHATNIPYNAEAVQQRYFEGVMQLY